MRHRTVFIRSFLVALLAAGALDCLTAAGQPTPTVLPPPNDDLAAALEVSGVEFQLAADLGAATREAFEPITRFQYGHSAWWNWTAPVEGIYEWRTLPGTNPVAVSVYQLDGFGQLNPVAQTYYRPVDSVLAWEPSGSFPAEAGDRYTIRLDLTDDNPLACGFGFILPFPFPFPRPVTSQPVAVEFKKSNQTAPPNDAFANRATLTGSDAVFTADLAAATAEPDEPEIAPQVLHRTLWWTWEAPGYGTATIRTHGTNEPPVVGVFTRGTLSTLTLLASSATEFGNGNYIDPGAHDSVEWDTAPGTRFEVQVDRFPRFAANEPAELELTFTPAPANDNAAEAFKIEGVDASLTVTNTAATRGADDWVSYQSGSNSVWFQWVAPARGIVQVTRFEPVRYADPSYQTNQTTAGGGVRPILCGGAFVDWHPPLPFVPIFSLYSDIRSASVTTVVPGTLLAFGTNSLIYEVGARSTNLIELDGVQGTSGTTPLNLLFIPPPPNDDFTNRIVLPSQSLRVSGRTFAAGREWTEPDYIINGYVLQRSVWWEWRAPTAGRWTLFVNSGDWDNQFVVYRGSTASHTNEAGVTQHAPLVFDCAAGEQFEIGVFATTGLSGNIQFTLAPVSAPAASIGNLMDYWNQGFRFVRLILADNSGLPYVVEHSDDLTAWTPVFTNANAWTHPVDLHTELGKPREFFRTRLQHPGVP